MDGVVRYFPEGAGTPYLHLTKQGTSQLCDGGLLKLGGKKKKATINTLICGFEFNENVDVVYEGNVAACRRYTFHTKS